LKEPIISVSGLRGIIGESLSPDLASRFACAFAGGLDEGPIVVSRDGRGTGGMLSQAIQAGLAAIGRDVIDADVSATPTTGVLVRSLAAAGGIQISASHNPPEYNGIKLFAPSGQVLDADRGAQVVQRYREETTPWVPYDKIGHTSRCDDPLSKHLDLVLATIDASQIRQRRFHVLLDSNHGAGSLLGRRLLEELGCEVTLLGGDADGQFEHTPEPTAENLEGVRRRVTDVAAEVGFCQDPDADRLALIDENGRYVGEEYTLAICLDHVLSRHRGPVVTNCATSRMSQDLAEKYECPFFRSAVGEANVVALMHAQDALFGGEGNGGPIDPRVGFVRDSFVGMALVLDALAAGEQPISALADRLPRYAIEKSKISLDGERIPAAFERLTGHFDSASVDRMDGLRLDWSDRWLLVRPSNTEPIVRVIAEAPSGEEAIALCREAASVLSVE
jgi:phosphomannomutase